MYCLHSLAEICHQRRLVPFFTGSTSARKKQREEWRRKAKASLRKDFEGWKVNSALLAQMLEEPQNEAASSDSLPPVPEEELRQVEEELSQVVEMDQDELMAAPSENSHFSFSPPEPIPTFNSGSQTPSLPSTPIKSGRTPIHIRSPKVLHNTASVLASKSKELLQNWNALDKSVLKLACLWILFLVVWLWSWTTTSSSFQMTIK